ncbi:hypothetical protein [Variovorax paradoxus]
MTTPIAVPAAQPERERSTSELPVAWPRQGIAAAQIADRFGRVTVEPVIVVDFYRQADPL